MESVAGREAGSLTFRLCASLCVAALIASFVVMDTGCNENASPASTSSASAETAIPVPTHTTVAFPTAVECPVREDNPCVIDLQGTTRPKISMALGKGQMGNSNKPANRLPRDVKVTAGRTSRGETG